MKEGFTEIIKMVLHTNFFQEKKESLSLYNSIMKTDYTDPDELEIVTLNSAIYIGRKNDNAIILHFNMLMTEFQTTFNPNMPLRTLIYVANEYEKYIAEHELNMYSEYIQEIPTPYFVTLYYGSKEQPEKQILKLITEGYSNVEIAKNLFVSVNTTKVHVASILQKLEVDDRLQAAIKALKERIV